MVRMIVNSSTMQGLKLRNINPVHEKNIPTHTGKKMVSLFNNPEGQGLDHYI